MGIILLITFLGSLIYIYKFIKFNLENEIFLRFLNIVTIGVPPALTVAMNLAITFSVTILKK